MDRKKILFILVLAALPAPLLAAVRVLPASLHLPIALGLGVVALAVTAVALLLAWRKEFAVPLQE